LKKLNRFYIKPIFFLGLIAIIISGTFMTSCKTPQAITNKSGAQLWAENCTRCHNAPDPSTYSDDQWDAAMEHMRQKALLTNAEVVKIRIFLKSGN
jgi:cytochrome c